MLDIGFAGIEIRIVFDFYGVGHFFRHGVVHRSRVVFLTDFDHRIDRVGFFKFIISDDLGVHDGPRFFIGTDDALFDDFVIVLCVGIVFVEVRIKFHGVAKGNLVCIDHCAFRTCRN